MLIDTEHRSVKSFMFTSYITTPVALAAPQAKLVVLFNIISRVVVMVVLNTGGDTLDAFARC